MNINELVTLCNGKILGKEYDGDKEILSGYSCDLLSWVMARGEKGMAWITVQTHLNVIAVATLLDLSCIIIPEGIHVDDPVVAKSDEEDIAIISSPMTAYEICGLMYKAGLGSSSK